MTTDRGFEQQTSKLTEILELEINRAVHQPTTRLRDILHLETQLLCEPRSGAL